MTTQRRNLALERLLATMLESPDRGGGVPSHTAEEGRLYWDKTNDDLYGNSDGSTTWQLIGGSSPETFLDFEEIAEPASPAADTMRLFAVDDSGVTTLETKDSDGHVFRVHEDTYRVARNTTGSQIDKGEAVYFSGSTGNKPNIAPAQADSQSTMPAIGVAAENIADNAFGIVSVIGRVEDVDTSAFSEGEALYVSATAAGDFTTTRPTHPNFAQFIGTVEVSGVGNGAILLNTEPTLLGRDSGTILNNFTIGDGTAGAKTVTWDNGNEAALSWEPTADRTVTMPDATGAVALTTVANVFTAAQRINGSLGFNGTATAALHLFGTSVGEMGFRQNITNDSDSEVLSWQDSGDNRVARLTVRGMDGAGAGYLRWEDADTYRFDSGHVLLNTVTDAAQLTVKADAPATVGLVVDTAGSPSTRTQIWRVNGADAALADFRVDRSIIAFDGRDFGNNVAGPSFRLHRNSNTGTEGPAAGNFLYKQADNTNRWTWVDNVGNLRIGTLPPTGSTGSPTTVDTAGTIVGTQSSWIDLKENIQPWHNRKGALQTVLDTPLFEFKLTNDSQLCHDGSKKRRHGLIIEDRTEWFAHNCGPQQIPALDERTLFGHLIASIQALHGRIENLEAQIGTT